MTRTCGSLAALTLVCLGVASTDHAHAEAEATRTRRLDLAVLSVEHLDATAEAVRDRVRRLVPGARVECYGPTCVSVLGRTVERRAASRLAGPSCTNRQAPWPHVPRRDRLSIPIKLGFVSATDIEDRLEGLQKDATRIKTLLRGTEMRYAAGRLIQFVRAIACTRDRLGALDEGQIPREEFDSMRVRLLRFEQDAGLFGHRLDPYDVPDAAVLRGEAEALLQHVNAVGRANAHGWRPGVPESLHWHAGFSQEDYALATNRDWLEEVLTALGCSVGSRWMHTRRKALFASVAVEGRHGFGDPPLKAEIARARHRERADFAARIRQGLERLVRRHEREDARPYGPPSWRPGP